MKTFNKSAGRVIACGFLSSLNISSTAAKMPLRRTGAKIAKEWLGGGVELNKAFGEASHKKGMRESWDKMPVSWY